jgi:hypothetical protein
MSLDELLHEVENTASDLNIISGFTAFLDVIRHRPDVESLVNALRHSPRNKEVVHGRLTALFEEHGDPGYAHPFDPAIAVYLYVLYQVDQLLAFKVAEQFSRISQLWWSRRLANYIIENTLLNQVKIEAQSQSITYTTRVVSPLNLDNWRQVYNTRNAYALYHSGIARMVS